MDSIELEERFLVVSHNRTEKPYRIVGSAYKSPGANYFTLYFRLFPGVKYYIAPHRDRAWEYVVFSGCKTRDDGSLRFFCKIGTGVHLTGDESIELHVPDLRQIYYIKLDPKDYHVSDAA